MPLGEWSLESALVLAARREREERLAQILPRDDKLGIATVAAILLHIARES